MPVKIFLEFGDGHLVGGLDRLLSTWGWEGRGLFLGSCHWLLCVFRCSSATLLRGFFLLSGFAGSIFGYLLCGFLNTSCWFNRFFTSLRSLSSSFGCGLLGSLVSSFNLSMTSFFFRLLQGALFLNVNILKLDNCGVAFLEWEVVKLVITLLSSSSFKVNNSIGFNFSFLSVRST